MFDIILSDGLVYEGDAPPRTATVAIRGDTIQYVGDDNLEGVEAERIDARGLVVCPGFIDLHAHSALQPFINPLLEPKIAQGFTTELIGLDGLSPAPVRQQTVAARRAYLRGLEGEGPEVWPWSTFAEYLDALEAARPVTNLVTCIGHNSVRDFIMGTGNRPPTSDELRAMRREVRVALELGARAVSLGLVYLPGVFANTDELIAIGEESARMGAPIVPHVRNESTRLLESHQEMIHVARRSGAALHLSHLKAVGNPDLIHPLIELIDSARADLAVTFDQYPYGAGSTIMASLLPPWAHEGGPDMLLARLNNDRERENIRVSITEDVSWENILKVLGPTNIVLSHASRERIDDVGKSLAQIATERGADAITAVFEILVDTMLEATRIDHYAPEAAVKEIFRHEAMLVGSDGIFGKHPHPRLYGTAPRVLGRFAHQERLIPVREAIARLTARPAAILGLQDRGRLLEGYRADIMLIDLENFLDTATFTQPISYPTGVIGVLVGGKFVWREGEPTGVRSGTVVRAPRTSL